MSSPRKRQAMCERRQRKARPKGTPLPPLQTCAEPSDAAWDDYAKRHKKLFGHPPLRDPHASKLVMDAAHAGTPAPEGERIGGRLVVGPAAAPKAWAGKVPFDPYREPDEKCTRCGGSGLIPRRSPDDGGAANLRCPRCRANEVD